MSKKKTDPQKPQQECQISPPAPITPPESLAALSPEATQRMLHELRVHQSGLEMQNEELRRAQLELEASKSRYFDLYDLAPVGYATVAENGLIIEANLTLATLLGVARSALAGKRFSQFILKEDQDAYDLLKKQVLASHAPGAEPAASARSCELRLNPSSGTPVWVSLVVTAARGQNGEPELRVVVTDISARRAGEAAALLESLIQMEILNAIPAHVASLDPEGVIQVTNESWRRFAKANLLQGPEFSVGQNYLKVCESATGPCSEEAKDAAAGIRRVLRGEVGEFTIEYPCHSPTEQRWFRLMATPLREGIKGGAVVMHVNITERKRAEQVLRESELRLRLALRGGDLGLWDWNPQTGGLAVNARWLAMLGLDPEGPAPHIDVFHSLVHPDDAPKLDHLFQSVILNPAGRDLEVEIRARRADGNYIWILDKGTVAERDAEGRPLRVVGTHMDITERKRAEDELRHSRERYELVARSAVDGIWDWDVVTNADYFSDRWCELLGYTAAELQPHYQTWVDHLHPEDRPGTFAALQAHLEQRAPYDLEYRMRLKCGEYRWFRASGQAIWGADGKPRRMAGSITDISERKEAEEKIRLSEERQELALATGALGLWDWDVPSGRVLFDERWCEMLGYEVSELEPSVESWRSLLHPDDRPDAERALDRHLAGDTAVYEAEFRLRQKSGQWAWILSRGQVVERDATGAAVRVTGTHMNLTERKQLEQQFLRSQRMESIGTLAGGIAHDLNNMLSPIMMSLAVLEMRFTDKESTDLLSIISDSAHNGAEMVSQILSFARGVEGRRVEVQLRHLIRELEKLTSETFLKNIQIRTIVPHDLWTVIGDPTQLHQVLLNLCVNARDAMPEGGTLTLSAANVTLDEHFAGLDFEARPGAYVLLQVEDTGTRIPASIIEKIFDPFFTTKEVGKGTGLGLSTTLTIIKSHGGFVRVESELERGAKFSIYLPAETECGPKAGAETKAEMPRGQGELILVVDDEAAVRRITEQTLQLFGYRVVLASDGSEAVATYARQRDEIAAVITDLNMPVMDGFAAIPVLRHINPHLPIVATTGLAVESQLSRVADLGIEHFLRKPCTAEGLLKALRNVLDTAAQQK